MSIPNNRIKLTIAFSSILFLFSHIVLGQDNSQYSKAEQELELQLREMLGSIRESYDSQDFVKTIELSQQGRSIADQPRFYNYYVAVSSNLGLALLEIGDTLQSIKVFEESLEKAADFQNTSLDENRRKRTLVTANIDLANALLLTEQYDSAIDKYEEALTLTNQDDIEKLLILNYNIAEAYLKNDKSDNALPYVVTANRLADKMKVDAYTASVKLLYGRYHFEKNDFKNALENFEQSIKFAQLSGYQEALINSYSYASKAYAQVGNYQKAYENSQKFEELQQDKFQQDRITAVQNATAKFKVDEVTRDAENRIRSEKLEAEIRRKDDLQENTLKWSLIALGIAGLLILLLLIGFNRRKRLNEELEEKNQIYLKEKENKERLLIARNALFSRISHELRTPMYGIVGISNILMSDETLKDEHQENIESLKYSADYLLSLINNVLEMNKLNRSTNNVLVDQRFDVRELCSHAVESAKYISPEHDNEFNVEIDDRIEDYYVGDSVRIMQVLINLLGNANKFTQDGTIELRVDLEKETASGHLLQFQIRDTGKGITKEKLEYIFDETKYLQQHSANEGTGLGLPISQKILSLFDSRLDIQSEEGAGTIISFAIELQYDKAELIADDSAPVHQTLKGLDILVVEDNKINQMVTKKILDNLNGNVSIAASGAEAIELTQAHKYDLILMDINMPPGMDGFEATKRIREFDTTTPVIALTAVEQIELENRMKNSSINDFLIKPFKTEELLDVIYKSLKR
ncbi:response regulator [Nonlabens ponticola]|uniref:histidine kinase n=1 Tax=Nonlabens ponticola TaxID=2496866 RepID=A0A3S9N0L8_9FLAO|nr:response regulator [Nonlabens ponticola]AZQ44938.1 response regulator [Nonlabens ponticola]